MTEHPIIFPNSKPKIFGSDTHATSLSGDVTTSGLDYIPPFASPTGSTINNNTPEQVIYTKNTSTAENFNFVFVEFIQGLQSSPETTGEITFRIRRDNIFGPTVSSVIVTDFTSSQEVKLSFSENNFFGSLTFVFTFEITNMIFGVSFLQYNEDFALLIELDIEDTHVATLTGNNNQFTKEEGVIPA